jgi:exodeoxyribonuclease V alpha subunit
MTASRAKLLAMLAKNKVSEATAQATKTPEFPETLESNSNSIESKPLESQSQFLQPNQVIDRYGNIITLNSKQMEFVTQVGSGKSIVLIGAAGTGKTTCQQGGATRLISEGFAGVLDAGGHKYLTSGTPGIVIVAYTRRAVANIRKNMPADLKPNCITIHKLLEYEPDFEEIIDPVSGETKKKMFFRPRKNEMNPLPSTIHTIIYEETSMLDVPLYNKVKAACPHNPQEIFLGDIQQLPPVFGSSILGFKLLELPVVELTEVYRQALESPIISLAHRVLSGKPIPAKEFPDWKHENKLTIHPWKKKIGAEEALSTAALFFTHALDAKMYDPEDDIILIPFNKSFGSDELNKHIAQHLARQRNEEVYEIISGFNKHYYSVGDKVLYDKEEAVIVEISPTVGYTGKTPQPASKTMDYWGFNPTPDDPNILDSDDQTDILLAAVMSAGGEVEERVRKASHTITLQMQDSGVNIKVDTASAMNTMMLGYALTVHKSQGSEWRKVFFVLHQSHATMIQRELLYTSITRAKEELYIICEPESFTNGIMSQKVKGNTLAEKAEFFKGKFDESTEKLL